MKVPEQSKTGLEMQVLSTRNSNIPQNKHDYVTRGTCNNQVCTHIRHNTNKSAALNFSEAVMPFLIMFS